MKSNTLKENLIYQTLYQTIRILTPLITILFILIWRFIDISRENIKISNLNLIKCIISAVIMFCTLVILNQFLPPKVYTTAIIITVGIAIYITMNFILKNYYFLLIIKSLINRGDRID